MQKALKLLAVLVFALAIAATGRAVSVRAADSPLGVSQDTTVKIVQGELTKVDMEGHSLTIKLEKGDEMQFEYDSSTTVEGRENGIQGLASDTGARLTIHFKEESGKKIATRIIINKSDK